MKRAILFCAVAGCVLAADVLSRPGLPEGRWAHPERAAPASASRGKTSPSGGRSSAPAFATTRRDSLRRSVAAGEVLITTLPVRVAGRSVEGYEMLRTPALSDLAGRSFFWRTRPRDEGRHRLLFHPQFADSTTGSRPLQRTAIDTLAMVVTVRPEE